MKCVRLGSVRLCIFVCSMLVGCRLLMEISSIGVVVVGRVSVRISRFR